MPASTMNMFLLLMISVLAVGGTVRNRSPCPPYFPYYCACGPNDVAELKLLKMCPFPDFTCAPCPTLLQNQINCTCPKRQCPICSMQQLGLEGTLENGQSDKESDQIFFRFIHIMAKIRDLQHSIENISANWNYLQLLFPNSSDATNNLRILKDVHSKPIFEDKSEKDAVLRTQNVSLKPGSNKHSRALDIGLSNLKRFVLIEKSQVNKSMPSLRSDYYDEMKLVKYTHFPYFHQANQTAFSENGLSPEVMDFVVAKQRKESELTNSTKSGMKRNTQLDDHFGLKTKFIIKDKKPRKVKQILIAPPKRICKCKKFKGTVTTKKPRVSARNAELSTSVDFNMTDENDGRIRQDLNKSDSSNVIDEITYKKHLKRKCKLILKYPILLTEKKNEFLCIKLGNVYLTKCVRTSLKNERNFENSSTRNRTKVISNINQSQVQDLIDLTNIDLSVGNMNGSKIYVIGTKNIFKHTESSQEGDYRFKRDVINNFTNYRTDSLVEDNLQNGTYENFPTENSLARNDSVNWPEYRRKLMKNVFNTTGNTSGSQVENTVDTTNIEKANATGTDNNKYIQGEYYQNTKEVTNNSERLNEDFGVTNSLINQFTRKFPNSKSDAENGTGNYSSENKVSVNVSVTPEEKGLMGISSVDVDVNIDKGFISKFEDSSHSPLKDGRSNQSEGTTGTFNKTNASVEEIPDRDTHVGRRLLQLDEVDGAGGPYEAHKQRDSAQPQDNEDNTTVPDHVKEPVCHERDY